MYAAFIFPTNVTNGRNLRGIRNKRRKVCETPLDTAWFKNKLFIIFEKYSQTRCVAVYEGGNETVYQPTLLPCNEELSWPPHSTKLKNSAFDLYLFIIYIIRICWVKSYFIVILERTVVF